MYSASRLLRHSLTTALWVSSGLLLGLALVGAFGCLLAVTSGVVFTTTFCFSRPATKSSEIAPLVAMPGSLTDAASTSLPNRQLSLNASSLKSSHSAPVHSEAA